MSFDISVSYTDMLHARLVLMGWGVGLDIYAWGVTLWFFRPRHDHALDFGSYR